MVIIFIIGFVSFSISFRCAHVGFIYLFCEISCRYASARRGLKIKFQSLSGALRTPARNFRLFKPFMAGLPGCVVFVGFHFIRIITTATLSWLVGYQISNWNSQGNKSTHKLHLKDGTQHTAYPKKMRRGALRAWPVGCGARRGLAGGSGAIGATLGL